MKKKRMCGFGILYVLGYDSGGRVTQETESHGQDHYS
jgi:hypothetical protein